MSRGPTNNDAPPAPPTPPASNPSWRSNEFDAAPTQEQLRKIQNDEQRQRELKAQTGQHRVSVTDAVKSIKKEDFINVHKTPCARQGFLTGIGGGAVVGALRFVLGAPIPKAANWAVGACAAGAVLSYEYCQYQRRVERENMKRVVEVYDRKATELRRRQEEEEEKKRRKATEEEAARLARQKSWFW